MALIGILLKPFRAGEKYLAWNRLEAAPDVILITSSAFADGDAMPRRYAGQGAGQNVSPPLRFQGVPRGTTELLLVVQDIDVPLFKPVVHLIARLPGTATTVAEGGLQQDHAVVFGRGTFGRYGYGGPRPIRGHGDHRYVFQLFAAGRTLDDAAGGGLKAHLNAIRGHVLARGRLIGTFSRN